MNTDRFHLIAAVFVLLIKDNKIFLNKRLNTGWEDGMYCLVGGHLEGNETAMQAAIREAAEEAGVIISPQDLQFCNVAHIVTNSERIHFSFVATKWQGEPVNNEPDKSSEAGWFPLDALPKNLAVLSRDTITWYKNNEVYSEFGWQK